MASSQLLPQSLNNTLQYFAKYDYQLTDVELWYWQHRTSIALPKIKKLYVRKLSPTRVTKEKISLTKWKRAFAVSAQLSKIPAILAVFVTGSLSMNNATKNDDIDLMLVVAPNTLWLTRLLVNLKFWSARRKPQTKNANNQICFNLWLDANNLHIKTHDLYRAHEVLQAKLLWEKGSIHQEFLKQNKWTQKYLPVAYKAQIKKYKLPTINNNYLLFVFNILAFIGQYFYMYSKITTEKVGLGFAFFHPRG